MIPRTPEPEVMDSPDEALDYDPMDHSEVNRVAVDDFLKAVEPTGAAKRLQDRKNLRWFWMSGPERPGFRSNSADGCLLQSDRDRSGLQNAERGPAKRVCCRVQRPQSAQTG